MEPTRNEFIEALRDHAADDSKRFDNIDTKLEAIKDNHLAHIQADMAQQSIDIASMKANQSWLMRGFWTVASTILGLLAFALKAIFDILHAIPQIPVH